MPLSALHVPGAPSRRNLQARFTPSHRDCKLHSVAVPARRARLTGFSCQRDILQAIYSSIDSLEAVYLQTQQHRPAAGLARYETVYLVAYITRTQPPRDPASLCADEDSYLIIETFFYGTSYSEHCRQSLIEARNARTAAPRRCSKRHAHFEYSRRHNVFQPERLAPLRPYTSCAVWRATTRPEPRIGSAQTVQLRRWRRCAIIWADKWHSPVATAASEPVWKPESSWRGRVVHEWSFIPATSRLANKNTIRTTTRRVWWAVPAATCPFHAPYIQSAAICSHTITISATSCFAV